MSSNKKKRLKDKFRLIQGDLYPALRNTTEGKVYGYINDKGVFIIKPIYSEAYDFNNNRIAIVGLVDKFGLIDTKGEYVVDTIYDSINEFKENRAIFNRNGYMGVINESGRVITDKKYDFINDYREGRAVIGINNNYEDYKYGYIDLDGNEVISSIYSMANDFNDGVALVKDEQYKLISLLGKVIETYNYKYVAEYNDGLMVFGNALDGPLGYINKEGKIVIEAKYRYAQGFKNEVAIVSESESLNGPYGLINKSGKYLYEPIFSDIKILGESRVALGMPIGNENTGFRSIYAIGTTSGNRLTDFIYLDVGEYVDGLAYASTEVDTFFIDKTGKFERRLPRVNGSGELSIKNGLIYANIDYSPYYINKNGEVVYKANDDIKLDDTYSVLKEKYKPNINYLIYNPVVQGVKNITVKSEINNNLMRMSYFRPDEEEGKEKDTIIREDDVLGYNYYGDFSIKYFKKNLLILKISGYYYPLGAAHGMTTIKTPSINLVTGKFYSLDDLFMSGVNWNERLNKIIKEMIDSDKQYDYVFKDQFTGIKKNQDFYIDDSNLYIYFPPYEIGPYSAGFITFKIPLSEIEDIINKDNEFYESH